MKGKQHKGAGPWAMEAGALRSYLMSDGDMGASPQPNLVGEGSVAIVPLIGPISKYGECEWEGSTSTLDVQNKLQIALDDSQIEAVILYVDSPGGTTSGSFDLAQYVSGYGKPIWAYVSDCGCSAAYLIASQCDKVIANKSAAVGSIGVYTALYDTSKAAEQEGVTVTLVKAGKFKGVGEPGTAITPEAVADEQRWINENYDLFIEAVVSGREMSPEQVQALADGRVHIASQALAMGLIDEIATLEDTLASIGGKMATTTIETSEPTATPAQAPADDVNSRLDKIEATLATLATAIQALTSDEDDDDSDTSTPDDADAKASARLTEILAAVGGRAELAIDQFNKGADAVKAKAALADVLSKEVAALKAANPKTSNDEQGPVAVGVSGNVSSDPEQMWTQNVDDVQAKFRGNKASFLALKKFEARKSGK